MKRAIRRTSAGLAVAGAAILIAGCGGGSDSLSAEELRTQADAICADADARTDAIADPTSEEELVPAYTELLSIQRDSISRLKELSPPSELESTWNEAISLQEEQVATLQGLVDRIGAGEDVQTVLEEVTPEAEAREEQLDRLADELGLTVCGQDDDETTEPTTTEGTTTAATTVGETTAPATTEATTPSTGAEGTAEQYRQDAQAATAALTEFGEILQSVGSPQQLEAQAPAAQEALDEFDAAIAKMDGYTLSSAELEQQRAAFVDNGPAISDVLRRFVDAAASGDAAAVQTLLPEVLTALTDFTSDIRS
jgi:hypothetical protein